MVLQCLIFSYNKNGIKHYWVVFETSVEIPLERFKGMLFLYNRNNIFPSEYVWNALKVKKKV